MVVIARAEEAAEGLVLIALVGARAREATSSTG